MDEAARRAFFDEIVDRFPAIKTREFLLAAGGRKTARTEVPERELHAFVALMERHGLYVAIHERKYVHAPDIAKGGWSNQYGIELHLESPHDGYLMVYIAASAEDALRAMRAEHSRRDDEFGDLLGIPACCRKSYIERIEAASSKQNDYLPLILDGTPGSQPFPYLNNIGAQYFDYCLLSFYPCSFTCQEAARVAWDAYEYLATFSSEWAKKFLVRQRSTILYTEYEGIYLIEQEALRDGWLYYHPEYVKGTINGLIFQLLGEGYRSQVLIGPSSRMALESSRNSGCRTSALWCSTDECRIRNRGRTARSFLCRLDQVRRASRTSGAPGGSQARGASGCRSSAARRSVFLSFESSPPVPRKRIRTSD